MATLFQAFEGDSRSFEQLDRHLLVVGQSGSGKSYFMGKIVEEIGIKTHARVVILDRAGDFVKLWLSSDEKNQSALLPAVRVHSEWPGEKLSAHFDSLVVHPYWFDALDLCAVLGLPSNSEYWGPIGEAQQSLGQEYDLSGLVSQIGENLRQTGATLPDGFNFGGIDLLTERLFMRHKESCYVERYGKGFHDTARRVVEHESRKAVVHVVDLSSLEREHARSILALAVLRALWKTSRNQWWHRHLTKEKSQRTATFLVIDEVHHLCPSEQMESPIGVRVRESLLEIATEGRKYGLWLVLGTQRPTRLHPTILAEISNFMLMRTTSSVDLEFLSKLFPNTSIESDLAQLERKQGWGFLVGEWASNGYEKVKVSSRVTAHIEGSFEPDEWFSDDEA